MKSAEHETLKPTEKCQKSTSKQLYISQNSSEGHEISQASSDKYIEEVCQLAWHQLSRFRRSVHQYATGWVETRDIGSAVGKSL